MQAVILAAGRGTRMKELTADRPKPLLEINGKTLLEYEFDALPDSVDEVVLVVGYLGGMIQKRFGGELNGKRILYVEQEKLDGTAGALWRTQSVLKDRFLVLMADDLYSKEDTTRALTAKEWILGVYELPNMRQKGKVRTDKKGNIVDVEEGDHEGESGCVGTNLFAFDTSIFQCTMVPKAEGSDEYGLPQTAIAAAQQLSMSFKALPSSFWLEISTPEDLKKAEEIFAAHN